MSNHRATYGRLTRAAAFVALAFAGFSGAAMADGGVTDASANYSYQTLDYPGSSQTIFWGLNDFGELAGQFEINAGTAHAMAYRHGRFELLDTAVLGTYFSAAGGPSDLGVTFGGYADATGVQHGFALHGNRLETVDFTGHLNSNVDGLNDFGVVLGVYWDADGIFHGVQRLGRFDTTFDVSGARDTYPLGINDTGESVGYWDTADGVTHGFYRDARGKITTLDVPGALATVALGINDVGQIAGYWFDNTGRIHAFVESKGKFTTFDMPGAANTYATAINNFGVIAGEWQDAQKHRHGLVATPKLIHSH